MPHPGAHRPATVKDAFAPSPPLLKVTSFGSTYFHAPDPSEPVNIAEVLRAKERELVEAALRAEGGVQARAARRLGVSRANLNYRIQKLGIIIAEL